MNMEIEVNYCKKHSYSFPSLCIYVSFSLNRLIDIHSNRNCQTMGCRHKVSLHDSIPRWTGCDTIVWNILLFRCCCQNGDLLPTRGGRTYWNQKVKYSVHVYRYITMQWMVLNGTICIKKTDKRSKKWRMRETPR